MRRLLSVLLLGAACFAQELSETERKALSQELSEAGTSAIELLRALEGHLKEFPKTPKLADIERLLVKAAMEVRDDRRIILYGERVLAREQDDLQVLERVSRALLGSDGKETSARALKYAQAFEGLIAKKRTEPFDARIGRVVWQEDLDHSQARALTLQSRATGNLGQMDRAVEFAKAAYAAYPTTEAAREVSRWLSRTGKEEEAVPYLADSFVLPDARNSDADRAADRVRMGELYRKVKGSEKGLGDLILEAYDRTTARAAERQSKFSLVDPNLQAKGALDFTLPGLGGTKLALATLRGKAVVLDFWATWCAPCVAQHPLYEEVKKRYRANPDVVFLSVNTDEDRTLVEPFLKEKKWSTTVYFEEGMSRKMDISSIPMTLVLNRKGEVISRMNGYVPNRFVDMLSERIDEALK